MKPPRQKKNKNAQETKQRQRKKDRGERERVYTPLGQASQVIPPWPLVGKRRDAEPRRVSVVLGPVVARDRVLDELATAARGLELGRPREVADERDLGDVATRRDAECATAGNSGGGETAGEERHFDVWGGMFFRRVR